tara:strand:+ start:21517 stop:22848 length:1332 start_codon:yes stop_codon:yes gene_type:complete
MSIKKFFSLVMLICGIGASAQSYIGFLSDNYSGVHTVISNPAALSGMPYRTDINLLGVSGFVGNDYYSVSLGDAVKADYDFSTQAKKSPSSSNTLFGNLDVLGPSFSVRLGEKTTMALFTRGRAWVNIRDINGQTFENTSSAFDANSDYSIQEGDFYAQGNAWSEIGLSFGTVLIESAHTVLRVGASVKYLQGYANSYVQGENVAIDYRVNGIVLPNNQSVGSLESSGQITYGYSTDFQDYVFDRAGSGFGFDLGLLFEWRKNQNLPYTLKIGASLMDIGTIAYDTGLEKLYDITNSVSQEDVDNAEGLLDLFDSYYTELTRNVMQTAQLPTAIHLTADYRFAPRWYFNLDANISMVSNSTLNASSVINRYAITPRYQTKWFSMYAPLSISEHLGFQWGAGLRFGPLYVGSGSILSVLTGDDTMGADVYAGLKLPIFSGRVPK